VKAVVLRHELKALLSLNPGSVGFYSSVHPSFGQWPTIATRARPGHSGHMDNEIEELEAVFYSGPIPSNLSTLTFLGLVFDQVHFPNVYIPADDFDPDEVLAEISRLQGLNLKDHSTWLLVELLKYALKPELRSFCHFTGQRSRIFDRNDADAKIQGSS
jgi:hypothetical protein